MTIYLVVPLLLVAAVLQTTVVPYLAVGGVFVDLPLVLVASWSLLRGVHQGIRWAFIAGLAVDLLSGAPFGAATLALMAAALLSGLAQRGAVRAHLALLIVTILLVTVLYDLVFLTVVQVSGRTVEWLGSLYRVILPSAILNAALMPLFFFVMRRLYTRFGRAEMEFSVE
jgi:rod shape-determining protein MreD